MANTTDKVFEYIEWYIKENRVPPSFREIMEEVGLASTSAVNYQLQKLEDSGRIYRHPNIARGIVIR